MNKLLILLFTFSLSVYAYAHKYAEGVIRDSNNEPLARSLVTALKSKTSVVSGFNGEFKILITEPGDLLIIQKEGFDEFSVPVDDILHKKANSVVLKRRVIKIDEVNVYANKTNSLNKVANVDFSINPDRSSQEVLRLVPGLFVAQHAGGGKSEQMFLRGFDLDHGTDINIGVNNMPVNAVSHAHGQGYTDLHFIIPELIDEVEFGKGPYNLKKGNLATAGYVNFKTKKRIEQNQISLGYGMYNDKSVSGLFKLFDFKKNHTAFIATNVNQRDGFFESSQNFERINIGATYSGLLNESTQLTFNTSLFTSSWDASGQIPERAVNDGSISRFGAIDDTEGGITGRRTAQLELSKFFDNEASLITTAYFSNYDFELYSNFTFFARDSINGDQIRQKETRNTLGFNSDYQKKYYLGESSLTLLAGVGSRIDNVNDVELSYTKNRTNTLEQVQLGDVNEANYFSYLGFDYEYKKWFINSGLRYELINHQYTNRLSEPQATNSKTLGVLLPKFSAKYQATKNFNIFTKLGVGFHSNDSRLVINQNQSNLAKAYSGDIGVEFKPVKKLLINTAFWMMRSESELVYVGDEGVVEANGASIRRGIDLGIAYQLFDPIFININTNYTHARYEDEIDNYIPLAPSFTTQASIQLKLKNGIRASFNTRVMGDRAAIEDNSIIAKGYVVNDLNIGLYKTKWNISLTIKNILNTEWNETQFLTESRLQNENQPIEEIHFTPGTPRLLKAKVTYLF